MKDENETIICSSFILPPSSLSFLKVSVLDAGIKHLFGDISGGGAAAAAVLDQHGEGDSRIVGRGKTDEPGVRAAVLLFAGAAIPRGKLIGPIVRAKLQRLPQRDEAGRVIYRTIQVPQEDDAGTWIVR